MGAIRRYHFLHIFGVNLKLPGNPNSPSDPAFPYASISHAAMMDPQISPIAITLRSPYLRERRDIELYVFQLA